MFALNNREIALLIWVSIVLIWLLFRAEMRKCFRNLLQTAFAKKLTILYFSMILYTSFVVYVLRRIGIWEVNQLKDTIIWAIFTGIPTLFKLSDRTKERNYFKDAVKDIFRFTIVTEFLAGLYTFSLATELIIQPFLFLVAGMLGVADTDKKYYQAKKFLRSVLTLLGFVLIIYTFYRIITGFKAFATRGTLDDFLLSPALSLVFFPFVYMFSIVMKYDNISNVINFTIADKPLSRYAVRRAIFSFRFKSNDLDRWKKSLLLDTVKSKSDVIKSIDDIKQLKRIEANPPEVPPGLGWSPYKAKDFLLSEGISTDYYTKISDDEWVAISPSIKLAGSDGLNAIYYSVVGNSSIAKELELELHLSMPQKSKDKHLKLLECAKTLYRIALDKELPENIAKCIISGVNKQHRESNMRIVIQKNSFPNHQYKGYSLQFKITANDAG